MNVIFPATLYALTSGPSQPESQSFQAAGVSDMVDLSTGDFKYNIPLMDVDGYPLNLNYQSGVGIDDEASWVGLGWNLNVGSINRQLRGVPDDFAGDTLNTTHFTKPKVTVGGKVSIKNEFKGIATLGGSFSLGVFSDNYVGVGAEIGVNAGISLDKANSNSLTASMGVGILSNTASGVDVTPSLSIGIKEQTTDKNISRAGLRSSLGYNSRSGLKSLTLGTSFSVFNNSTSLISYNTEPIMPKIQVPRKSSYSSFSFDLGPAIFGNYTSLGGMGYRNINEVVSENLTNREYGFLYAERGKNDKNAVMDFVREKDNPVINELPNLALPVHTPDLFSYTSQNGSGQFRLFRGGTGVFYDNEATDKTAVNTFGGDIGFGLYAHAGVTAFNQGATTTTRKWQSDNQYLKNGDFQDQSYTNLAKEHVFFRKVDEKGREDVLLTAKLKGTLPIAVNTTGKIANLSFRDNSNYYATSLAIDSVIERKSRQPKSTVISYLTAEEAKQGALDKTINTYSALSVSDIPSGSMALPVINLASPRVQANKAAKHHISEMTVTGMGGERMIYGIPVYNTKQEEYSFAVGRATNDYNLIAGNLIGLNLAGVNIDHKKGIDQYYHKESLPAYATSFLLTALVSPDYQDKTNNGISDDDQGTAIKFNYSKINNYKWRTPYAAYNGTAFVKTASLNKGLLADPVDDKGSILYGEKELYYVQTIESKTQIAYFITADRLDGLGVMDFKGDRELGVKQKCLKEIRLYSKADRSKPIKVVKFEYSYELCPGTPNSVGNSTTGNEDLTGNNNGKLTLKKVWFEYGNASKGKYHPYIFEYNKLNSAGALATYASLGTDRWGVYKLKTANPSTFSNDEFPYADQNATNANINAGLFHLSKITLPTGGNIDVVYEADDYAYVQDKKATVMTSVQSFNGVSGTLKNATGLTIPLDDLLPGSISPTDYAKVLDWFKKTYLNGSDYVYNKSYVKVSTPNANSYTNDYDFVSAYCKVNRVEIGSNTATSALLKFEPVTEGGVTQNPILFAARQKMKNEYPRYAYPGFENSIKADNAAKALAAAVGAIVNAAKNLSELKENFYQKANRRDYATTVDVAKSFVRLVKNSGRKLGGGLRVKQIAISDNWDDFTGTAVLRGIYGQSYEYTKQENGKLISSGVASYEPAVGNDENPLKQAVPYIQKIKGAINNFFELEEPFGESFFPSPSVIYSKVTVKDLEAGGTYTANPKTGSIVNEFYTAKDFPVKVKILPIQKYNPKPQSTYSLVKTNSIEELVLSQGYSIELNDMHGKSKATRVLNQAGAEISSSVYYYQVEDPNAESLKLNNKVSLINDKGVVIPNQVMGRDIELFTDFREQEYKNSGQAVNLGGDLIPIFFGIPFPLPHFPVAINNDYRLFRSVCAVKVIQSFGILQKVVKTENGSSIAVENMAYDAVTGETIVTKTQNEFGKDYYSVNLPAYWVYKGMGPAYQTLGTLLKGVVTNASGNIVGSVFTNFLMPGDELVDIALGDHYWVIETLGSKKIISRSGAIKVGTIPLAKIIRSGYRNQLQPATSTLVCMNNPIQGNVFRLASGGDLTDLQVINASTNLFDEQWAVNAKGIEEAVYPIIENTSGNFAFKIAQSLSYSHSGYLEGIRPPGQTSYPTDLVLTSAYWGGYIPNSNPLATYPNRINEVSIWPNDESGSYFQVSANVTVPTSKIYYLAVASNFGWDVNVDCVNQIFIYRINFADLTWTVYPVMLTEGTHLLSYNIHMTNPNTEYGASIPKYFASELYDNTREEIINAQEGAMNILFSTKDLRNKADVFSTINGVSHYTQNSLSYPNCSASGVSIVNPYLSGYLGNWRPYQTKVYQEKRNYGEIFKEGTKGINAKNAGFYGTYTPWWKSNGTSWLSDGPAKWITANTVTLYDKYGQELENKDALNRYSAANFDFNGELPAAVASNAMNREIFTNSFEDERFKAANGGDNIKTKFKNNANGGSITGITTSAEAHTGTFSLALTTTGVTLATKTHNNQHKTGNYLSAGANGYQLMAGNIYPNGFEPVPNKEYIISAWVKDFQPNNRNVNMAVQTKTNGAAPVTVTMTCKAVIEGWKLLEGKFTTTTADQFEVVLKANSETIYLDDVRIHPKDAHLKSYAYSYKNFKLMAELDENAFATFYEYDDEGSLIRVKKETERGIMTLKETRSSYRKNPLIP